MEKEEKEFKQVVEILKKVYEAEKYWFDSELINETIKVMKQIKKKTNV